MTAAANYCTTATSSARLEGFHVTSVGQKCSKEFLLCQQTQSESMFLKD